MLGFSPATPAGGISAPLAVLAQDETSGCEAADFADVPAGAVVLVRRGTCPFGVKSANAAAARAAAVLVANNVDGPLDQATLGDVTGDAADRGAEQGGRRRAGRTARRGGEPRAGDDDRGAASRNVVAQTTTGNPDNVVMAGAHLDSVPAGPGINDNGSGTAALLETAVRLGGGARRGERGALRVLGRRGGGPDRLDPLRRGALRRRPAEDRALPQPGHGGLAERRLPRLRRRQLRRRGAGPGPEGSATVERVLLEQLATPGVTGEGTDFDGRSDYGPFIAAGIPAGGLFTGAEEIKTPEQAQRYGGTAGQPDDRCYHQACDRIDNIDRTALDRNVDAFAGTVGRFALSTDGIPA